MIEQSIHVQQEQLTHIAAIQSFTFEVATDGAYLILSPSESGTQLLLDLFKVAGR